LSPHHWLHGPKRRRTSEIWGSKHGFQELSARGIIADKAAPVTPGDWLSQYEIAADGLGKLVASCGGAGAKSIAAFAPISRSRAKFRQAEKQTPGSLPTRAPA
jgi:hypothetical protein